MSKQDILIKIGDMDNKLNNIEGLIQHLSTQLEKLSNNNYSSVITDKKINKKSVQIEKNGDVIINKYKNNMVICGDTFNKKSLIKSEGGYWSPTHKGWIVKLSNFDKIKSKMEKYSNTLNIKEINQDLEIDNTKKTIHIHPKNKETELESYGFIDDD